MILETLLFVSLFHHKKQAVPPPVDPTPQSTLIDKRMDNALDLMELNSRTLHSIVLGKEARLEGDEITAVEAIAVKCFTDKDPEEFFKDVLVFDKAVDELLVLDEFNKVLAIA
jgi:hypothetical protein